MQLTYVGQKKKYRLGQALVSLFFSFCFYKFFASIFALSWERGYIFTGGMGDGLKSIWNSICSTLGSSDYIILPLVKGGSGEAGLAITLLFLITALIGFFFLRIGARWPFVLTFLAVVSIYIFTGARGDDVYGLLLLASTVLVFFAPSQEDRASADGKRSFNSSAGNSLKVALPIVALTLVIIVGINSPNKQRLAITTSFVSKIQQSSEETFDKLRYGSGVLKEGRLSEEKKAEQVEGTALELTVAEGQKLKPMYLRGFVGTRFEGDRWQPADPNLYYSAKDLLYWLQQGNLDVDHQLATSFMLARPNGKKAGKASRQKLNVEVKNVGASRRYIYLPYTNLSTVEDAKIYPGSSSFGRGLRGAKTYEFEAIDDGYWKWTDRTAQMFAGGLDANKRPYYQEESYYNNFMYENMTHIPDDVRFSLEQAQGSQLRTKEGHVSYKVAIKNVNNALMGRMIYTENAGSGEEGVNRIESFLKQAKGYDAHFASAATMMFRYYGIPARYVEGYIVSEEDISKSEGSVVKVPKKNNHAWTEIYIDGMGFVPIETSEPYMKIMRQADMSKGLSNTESLNPYKFPSQNMKVKPPEESKEKKTRFPWDELIFFVVMVLIIGAILILAFLLANAIYLAYREKKVFMQEDATKGASAIYGALLDLAGVDENVLKQDTELWKIANRAAFSKASVSDDERNQLFEFFKTKKKEKREERRAIRRKKLKMDKETGYNGKEAILGKEG